MTPQFVFMSPKAEKLYNILKNRYPILDLFDFSFSEFSVYVTSKTDEEVSFESLNDIRMFALGAYAALTF